MNLAIFDLDNTLLAGDSDHGWGEFLVSENVVPRQSYKTKNDAFYDDYKRGELNMLAYQEFVLQPLTQLSADQLRQLHEKFMQQVIADIQLPKAHALVDQHRQQGDTLLVITATNRFITEPIVNAYGIENLLCTELETVEGKYTGKVQGEPCYQDGKIRKLENWLKENNQKVEHSYFYSDSHNDIPLLEYADEAFAVDPDETLAAHAKAKNWPIISLR